MRAGLAVVAFASAAAFGCGSSGVDCRAGRTAVDGVCVNERVADYVACVRAQGASLDEEKRRKLDVEAAYAGSKAEVVSDAQDSLEKKYSASDAAVLEIVRQCSTMVGGANRAGGGAPQAGGGGRRRADPGDAPPPPPRGPYGARNPGDRVQVNWKGSCYAARIVRITGNGRYRITYEGYDKSWDETIGDERFCP